MANHVRKKSGHQVGILGGSFNPPHLGHLYIAESCRQKHAWDELWMLPLANSPHKKKKSLAPAKHRVAMLKALLRGLPQLKVNLSEIQRDGPSYTFDTMTLLQKKYPNTTFHFIIGSDVLQQLSTWHRLEELANIVNFILVPRPGWDSSTLELTRDYLSKKTFQKLKRGLSEIPQMDISSRDIRTRLKKGQPVFHLSGKSVASYLDKNKIYT